MLTLTQATDETRTIIKWILVVIAAVFLVLMMINFGKIAKEMLFPTPPPPPTVTFGKLPPIQFPKNATDQKFSYTLNTISGTLPSFPDRAVIVKIDHSSPNLLALQKTQDRVTKIGFTKTGKAISDILYAWNDPQSPYRKLTFNILTSDFHMTSEIFTDSQILAGSYLPNEQQAKINVSQFLEKLDLLPTEIDDEKTKITLLEIKNLQLTPATSLSKSQIIRVDLFQKDYAKLPVYYPHPPFSTMSFFIGSLDRTSDVVMADFTYQKISSTSATYPIKTAQQAYDELKNGDAYIAAYYGNKSTITIKNIFLGYYLGEAFQEYLMPIVVFEGDDGFFAYVLATQDLWIYK